MAKRGMPEFKPTKEQRRQISVWAGLMSWDALCPLVINPRTGQPITKTTLQKHFPNELAAGKSRLQAAVTKSFYQQIEEGQWPAIQFALRHIFGMRDDTRVQFGVAPGGDDRPAALVTFHVGDGEGRPLTNGHANGHATNGVNGRDAI